jgi:hypothetical protein
MTCLVATGCGNMTKGKAAAETQVSIFHEQFNNRDFDTLVNNAHPDMLKESTGAKVAEFCSTVRTKLGKVKDSKTQGWNVRGSVSTGTTVVLVTDTTFEEGKGTETFTFRIESEKARLVGYNINSQDLILK